MIVLMGALLGTTFTTLEKKRLKLLVGMKSCAFSVKTALIRRGHTLDRALLDAKCTDTRLFKRCGEIFAEHPLYDAKTAAQIAAGATREEGVDADITEAFTSLIGELSCAGCAEQIEQSTLAFNERMDELIRVTKEVRMKKAGTVKNLCLFSGIALGIILI